MAGEPFGIDNDCGIFSNRPTISVREVVAPMSIYLWNWWRKALFSPRPVQATRCSLKRLPKRSRRLVLEQLEDRVVPSVTLLSEHPGLSFATSGGTGVPPDSQGAAGPTNFVESVNQAVSIYPNKSSGAGAVTDQLADFYFTKGGLPHLPVASGNQEGQSDTFVVFDPLVQRYIVGDIDFEVDSNFNPVNGGQNALLIAVSKSATPTTLTNTSWNFFEVNTTETGIALQDYPGNVGYNADALVITLNSFSTTADVHTQVNAISMNALINGTALTKNTNYFQTDINEFLPRTATMNDAVPGGPMWMVAAAGMGGQSFTGAANTVDVLKMTNVLSANPTFTTTTLTVNPYFLAVPALQPNGQAIISNGFIDSRIMKTSVRNGTLVASQIVSNAAGDEDNARWYAINVSSGAPTIQQQGDVSGGPGNFDIYPAIDINSQNDIGMTFMHSGTAPGQFLSVYVTGRTPGDAPGTMEAPVLAQAGAGNYTESTNFGNPPEYRLGDVEGISVDANGSFWAVNEYANTDANANWGTAIANFTLGQPINIVLTSATEGVPLTNVPVATFLDSSGVSLGSYKTTIVWGDGAITTGRVVASGTPGLFEILGSHTYVEEGKYSLVVSVNNGKTTLGPVSGIVTVDDAPLSGFAQALNGETANFVNNALVAVFSDSDASPETSSNYFATIQWFEGNGLSFSSDGTIQHLFGNTFAVHGSTPFTYPSGGLFTVRVFVHDVGGALTTVDSVINVSHNPAIPPLVPQSLTDTGPVIAQYVSMEDALTNLLSAERLFLTAVSLGTMAQKQGSFSNLLNAFFAYEAAIFAFDMQLPGS
jgi:hypothetical protein